MKIRAFLFDMDGLLVDTEDLHLRSFATVAGTVGVSVTARDLHGWVGKGQHRLAAWIVEEAGKGEVDAIVEAQRAAFFELLAGERPSAQPGAGELLAISEELELAIGLVSNSDQQFVDETMKVVLPNLGRPELLGETFHTVVTRDDVKNPKPAPNPYLKAAKALGLEPGECLAFEDSPSGVASAKAAGCPVVAVPCPYLLDPTECTREADHVFSSLLEVALRRPWA